MKFKTLKIFMVLISLAWIVSACSSPPPEPSHTPQPTETPEEGQTITLINPPNDKINNDDTKKYQVQTRITGFQLLSDNVGLVWGVTKNELRLYITRDKGATWANISPAPNVQFLSNPTYGKGMFFTDPDHGWIIRSAYDTTENIVLRTTDGGQTWKISSLGDDNDISSMYFMSPQQGWVMTSWNSSVYKESKALYATSDGGATWKEVMQNEQYNPNLPNHSIPYIGVSTGFIFNNSTHGFVSVQTGALPKIYMTKDGGQSWNQGPVFEMNEQLENCDRVIAGKPEFFDATKTNGWMPVGCQKDAKDTTTYHGYFTANGGANWKFVPFNLLGQTGVNRDVVPTFLNPEIGKVIVGDVFYQTVNQGQTWIATSGNDVLKSKLEDYPEIIKMQFFSKDTGWLLLEKKDHKRSLLLQTTDGGVHWRVI